jgi:hypothetical protein
MERLIVLNTKGIKCVLTKPEWVDILESNIEPYKYGFKGYIVLRTKRYEGTPTRIHSVHLENSTTLKNLKVKIEKY